MYNLAEEWKYSKGKEHQTRKKYFKISFLTAENENRSTELKINGHYNDELPVARPRESSVSTDKKFKFKFDMLSEKSDADTHRFYWNQLNRVTSMEIMKSTRTDA